MTFENGRLDEDELRAKPLGDRIYRIRESLDLSQAEVAEAVGVNVKTVNRWENDLADPQRKSRIALATLTGYPESMFKRKARQAMAEAEDSSVLAELVKINERIAKMDNRVDGQLGQQEALLARLGAMALRIEEALTLFAALAERLDPDVEEPGQEEEREQPE